MRHSRQLTHTERWELGLFLAMMVVGCLCLTAIMNIQGLPRLWATPAMAAKSEQNAQSPVAVANAQLGNAGGTPVAQDWPNQQLTPVVPEFPVGPAPTIEKPAAAKKPIAAPPASDIKWYKGEKYRYVRTLRLRVTAYAPDGRCCWPYPGTTTATGLSVKTNHGHLVAADPRLIPMHSLVAVPGYSSGTTVPVLDQGGAIKGRRLDVMLPSFDAAKEWGSRLLDVKVYEPVE